MNYLLTKNAVCRTVMGKQGTFLPDQTRPDLAFFSTLQHKKSLQTPKIPQKKHCFGSLLVELNSCHTFLKYYLKILDFLL